MDPVRWPYAPEFEIMQYSTAFLLLGGAVLLTVALLTLNKLVSPHKPTREKLMTYECGEDPVGTGWLRFNIRFYVVALVFVLFDVELALMYPVGVVFSDMMNNAASFEQALAIFADTFFFFAVLGLGLVYILVKGDLGWIRSFRTPHEKGLRSWETQTRRTVAPSEKATNRQTAAVGD